jgi:hypothetical protein
MLRRFWGQKPQSHILVRAGGFRSHCGHERHLLHYEAIARTVVALLRALTVGVHGDWGAGKSGVLKMVETEICKEKQVSCLWFNGWAFQGFDDAKTVLIAAFARLQGA